MTEYILMLGFLTGIGLLIMRGMVGSTGTSGAVGTMSKTSAEKIAADERP